MGGLDSDRVDHSELFQLLESYFRSRGVTREGKIRELSHRWIAQKGYRRPHGRK